MLKFLELSMRSDTCFIYNYNEAWIPSSEKYSNFRVYLKTPPCWGKQVTKDWLQPWQNYCCLIWEQSSFILQKRNTKDTNIVNNFNLVIVAIHSNAWDLTSCVCSLAVEHVIVVSNVHMYTDWNQWSSNTHTTQQSNQCLLHQDEENVNQILWNLSELAEEMLMDWNDSWS